MFYYGSLAQLSTALDFMYGHAIDTSRYETTFYIAFVPYYMSKIKIDSSYTYIYMILGRIN